MKDTFWMVIAAIALVAILFLVSSRTKPPVLPADEKHSVITTEAACTGCHAPGKAAPLKQSHPFKEQCLTCHRQGPDSVTGR